jgi:hypothetical protein
MHPPRTITFFFVRCSLELKCELWSLSPQQVHHAEVNCKNVFPATFSLLFGKYIVIKHKHMLVTQVISWTKNRTTSSFELARLLNELCPATIIHSVWSWHTTQKCSTSSHTAAGWKGKRRPHSTWLTKVTVWWRKRSKGNYTFSIKFEHEPNRRMDGLLFLDSGWAKRA